MPHVDVGAQRSVGVSGERGDERLRRLRVPGDQRADDMVGHVGPGGRVADDAAVLLGHAQLVGEGGQPRDHVGAVGAEDLFVQPEDGGEVLRRGRAGGHLGLRAARSEHPTEHLGPAADLESQLLVERAPVLGRVQGQWGAAHLFDDVPHQMTADTLAGMPLGDENHADRTQLGAVTRSVFGHHARGDETAAWGRRCRIRSPR